MTVSDLDLAAENIKRRVDEFFHRAIIDPVTLRESNIEIHTQPGWGFEHSILYSIARKIIPAGWEPIWSHRGAKVSVFCPLCLGVPSRHP